MKFLSQPVPAIIIRSQAHISRKPSEQEQGAARTSYVVFDEGGDQKTGVGKQTIFRRVRVSLSLNLILIN